MNERLDADPDLERMIAASFADAPKPRLSSGFAAKVLDECGRIDRRRERFRGARLVQAAVWAAAILGSGWIITGLRWPAWIPNAFLLLTPFVFVGLAFSRRILPEIAALIDLRRKA